MQSLCRHKTRNSFKLDIEENGIRKTDINESETIRLAGGIFALFDFPAI